MENYSEQEIYDLLDELTDDYLKCFIESDNTSDEITIHSVKQSKSFTFKWLQKTKSVDIENTFTYILDLNNIFFDNPSNELVELVVDFDDDTCSARIYGITLKDVEQALKDVSTSAMYKLTQQEVETMLVKVDEWIESNIFLRKGQTIHNYLFINYPAISAFITNHKKKLDPFYDDSKIPALLNFITR